MDNVTSHNALGIRRLRSLWSGFRRTLAFDNWWFLIAQRLFSRSAPLNTYQWKEKWWLLCDLRAHDHFAAKEVLAAGDYDRYIKASSAEGRLSYVNVGAHIGTFDIAAASLAPRGTSGLSIELNPETYERLRFNLNLNNLCAIHTLNAAICAKSGSILFSPCTSSLEDNIWAGPSSAQEIFRVCALTLETAIDSYSGDASTFDLLKIDCEGAEYEIIAEAPVAVLRRFRAVVIELHPPPADYSVSAIMGKMEEAGFQMESSGCGAGDAQLCYWTQQK